MIVSRLELFNFRNYINQDIDFSPGNNLIVGKNAQGKSNLLEAIYLLSYLKSKRAYRLRDLIREGERKGSARCLINDGNFRASLKIVISPGGRMVEVNGQRTEPAARAKGILKCIMFAPDDPYLVKGEPARRRDFLNETAEGADPTMAVTVQRYNHLLRQRNAALKRWEEYGAKLQDALEPWNRGMAEAGGRIVFDRLRMVRSMEGLIEMYYQRVSGDEKRVTLVYKDTFGVSGDTPGEISEEMRSAMETKLAQEKRARSTIVGPHRDDVEIRLGGRETRSLASQGEQRTIAFCMRLAQKEYIRKRTGKVPVLALDDVLSELDEGRRKRVLELAGEESQMFITATDLPAGLYTAGERMFVVDEGRVEIV